MAVAVARTKTVRIAPRKMRLVADLIRGRKVVDARDVLAYTLKGAAPVILKVLEAAVANAENAAVERRERVDTDAMVISTILINEGPTLRRYRPVPRGRATRIRKRTSHVELYLDNQ